MIMGKEWYIVTAKCKEQKYVFVKSIYALNPVRVLNIFMQEDLPIYAEPNSIFNIKIELDNAYEPNKEEISEVTLKWCGNGIGWKYVTPAKVR